MDIYHAGIKMKKMELLCPAGTLAGLKTAVDFGADAVYMAGGEFGMRTAAAMSDEALCEGIKYAHSRGVRVFITCNTVPHNDEIKRLPPFLEYINSAGADAVIASDLGTMRLIQKYAPDCALHISVQSGIVNSETARAFYELGARRVVLARELTLEEIAQIRAETPPQLELEAFAHGAMCVSFSARCLLSDYMTGRDANRGACAQACRWKYSLCEEKRPGQYFDITEDEKGSYILNADDLKMAEHLDSMSAAGIDSIKIEGRAKSEYYVAVTANAYRGALDSLFGSGGDWKAPEWVTEELEKISHRPYSTGFYFGRPNGKQTYASAGYLRSYTVAATVTGYRDGCIEAQLKNKFLRGQQLDCLEPGKIPFKVETERLFNGEGEPIDSAPHPMMTVLIPFEREVAAGAVLRMKTEE